MKFMAFLWRLWAGISAVLVFVVCVFAFPDRNIQLLLITLGCAAVAGVALFILTWAAGAFTGDRYDY